MQTYAADALGRVVTATSNGGGAQTFAYSGMDNTIASDGGNTYSRDPDGGLVGIGAVGGGTASGVLALTDVHDDVVGDFTASGAALAGSAAYDPLGNVTASTAPAGRLGYQSGWTDSATGKVNMAARWYNPAVGQFQNQDTVSLDPIPESVAANPFAYVDDNPLTRTDPTGHNWLGDAWHATTSAASTAWHATTSAVSRAYHAVTSAVSRAYHAVAGWVSHAYHTVTHFVADTFSRGLRAINNEIRSLERQFSQSLQAARRAAARAKQAAKDTWDRAHEIGKYAYHAAAKAVHTSVTFVKHHAAAIASFAVYSVVFAGCEAALGSITAGVGAVAGAAGCGALAGAAGGAVDQGAKCLEGQRGACSASSFGKSIVLGAAGGAIGGGIAGGLGGRLAESAIGKAFPRLVTDTLEGAGIGGIAGGTTSAADYGLTCSGTTAGCSWSGAAHAALTGAAVGALGGGAGGAGLSGLRAVRARLGGGRPNVEPAEGRGGGRCVTHSFAAATSVLMADGSSKPISHVAVGDKVATAVPGGEGKKESHTVGRVIVTTSDHDFVDLTIATHDTHGHPASVGTVTTTDHHPFYDVTRAAFVDAAGLKPGDRLQQPGGHTATVLEVRRYQATHTTYDLTINDLHTYYVETAGIPVLVHNCGSGQPRGADGRFKQNPDSVPEARYARVTLRSSTKQAIQDSAPRDADGNFIDPNTGESIPVDGPFHYGHKPGFEYWRNRNMAQAARWTRGQFIEYENNPGHYQIEDPYNNMGHRYEQP